MGRTLLHSQLHRLQVGPLNANRMLFSACGSPTPLTLQPLCAAYRLFDIIDRVPAIDSSSDAGVRPPAKSLTGSIEFRNVTFAYPSRPTEVILREFSLKIEGGSHVALVGESGSGKSTLMQLMQRFYDPQSGSVLVDGIDVKEWNLRYLRDRIGVVSQEPTLFAATVAQVRKTVVV